MKLYVVGTSYKLGEIEEAEVLKETEKTYTIKRASWGTNQIRKSEMRVYNGLVVETQEEARNKLKELLQKRVENLKSNIEKSNAEILKFNSMLEDMRKEDEGK
jgi:hypothetical protein